MALAFCAHRDVDGCNCKNYVEKDKKLCKFCEKNYCGYYQAD
jgi:hypothetical protein